MEGTFDCVCMYVGAWLLVQVIEEIMHSPRRFVGSAGIRGADTAEGENANQHVSRSSFDEGMTYRNCAGGVYGVCYVVLKSRRLDGLQAREREISDVTGSWNEWITHNARIRGVVNRRDSSAVVRDLCWC